MGQSALLIDFLNIWFYFQLHEIGTRLSSVCVSCVGKGVEALDGLWPERWRIQNAPADPFAPPWQAFSIYRRDVFLLPRRPVGFVDDECVFVCVRCDSAFFISSASRDRHITTTDRTPDALPACLCSYFS